MQTLDQYRAADISSSTSDIFEAADAFQASQVPQPSSTFEGPQGSDTSLLNQGMEDASQTLAPKPQLDEDPYVSKLIEAGQGKTAALLKGFKAHANALEPGFFTKALTLASGQTWEAAKNSKINTINEAQQLIDEGKFELAHQRLNYAAEGITEVTSPIEFAASGAGAAIKIAGKTALKVFAAGAPLEYTGTMVFEEVGEDNMLIGLAGEIASGVLAGSIGQKMINAAERASVNAISDDQIHALALKLRPASGKDILEYAWPKTEQALAEMRAALPGQSFELTDPLNVYSRLGAKRAEADEADYLYKFKLGDVTDYRVRGAYENLVSELNSQEVTPETAGIVRAIELKLQGTAEPRLGDYTVEASAQVSPSRPNVMVRKKSEAAGPVQSEAPTNTQAAVETPQAAVETPQSVGDSTPVSAAVETPQDVIDAPVGPVETQGKIPDVDPAEYRGNDYGLAEGPSEAELSAPVTLTPDMPLPVAKTAGPDYSPFGEPPALNADQIKALEQETIEEWFGKPKFNVAGMRELKPGEAYTRAELDKIHGNVINQYAKRLQKLDPALAPDDALRQAQAKFYDDLARGIHGENYKDDVDDLFNTLVSNAKKAKQKVNIDDLRAKAHELTYQEYVAEYEKALAKKKASVRAQGGIKEKYIEGYTGRVWEDQNMVELNIKVHPETGSLVYDSTPRPPLAGSKTKAPFKSRNFDYSSIRSRADVEHAMKQFINAGENSRIWTVVDGKKKKILPGAEKVRGKSWYYNSMAERTEDTEGLTDSTYIQVAKLYGWDESLLPPYQTFDAAGKQSSHTAPEDIIKGFSQYNEFEQSMPGWLRSEADQGFVESEKYIKSLKPGQEPDKKVLDKIKAETRPDPRYYSAVFGRTAYLSGLKDFLRQKFNLPVNAEPWKLTQRVEELAVMQSKLLEDITLATGTPQEAFAKRMYLLFKDKITGSHSLEYAQVVNQARQRELGYYEVLDFQGKRTKNPAMQLEADQGKYGMTGTETPEGQLLDDLDNFDADNPAYDSASIRPANDADAYEEGLSIKSKGPGVDPYAQYAEERKLYYAKQVNEIENKFGVRYADEPYGSSALGGSGKFNLFKINSAADLMLSLEHLDAAFKEAPVFVDVAAKFGITPKPGLPATQVAKLGTALTDAQLQLDDLAARMIQEPNNVVATLGFEKMRAIHQTLVDALTVDDISLSAPKLDQFNFMATDDIQMAGNFGKQIMENFVMYSKIGPDTRVSTLMAQMYNSLPTPQAKSNFLRNAAVLETNNPPVMAKEAIKMRQQLSRMIEDACGRH